MPGADQRGNNHCEILEWSIVTGEALSGRPRDVNIWYCPMCGGNIEIHRCRKARVCQMTYLQR